jgi:hypothetical protein
VPASEGEGTFSQRMTVRETRSQTSPKLAHRAYADVNVFIGSHRVTRGAGDPVAGARASRPVLRGVGAQATADGLLVPAPSWPVRILHFPLRSYEQFESRVSRIARAEGAALRGRRRELEDARAAGRLREVYAEMVSRDIDAGLEDGRLVRDTGFRDYLAACPDPVADGAPAPIPVAIDRDRRDAELAELAEDMMRTFMRTEHTLLAQRARARERMREAKRKLAETRRSQAGPDDAPSPAKPSGRRRLRDTASRVVRGG